MDNEDLEVLRKEKIRGRAFLSLTEEKIIAIGLKFGPVSVIAGYIEELKGMCHLSSLALYILQSVSLSNCFLQILRRTHELEPVCSTAFEYPQIIRLHTYMSLYLYSGIPLKRSYDGEDTACITDEGADKLAFIPDDRLAMFVHEMNNSRVILLRSPPESGKSTLGILLQRYLVRKGRNAVYLSMLSLRGDRQWALQSDAGFDIFWKERTGKTLGEFVSSNFQMDIIIDEVQLLYGNVMPSFWFTLKDLKSGTRNPHLRILLMSMYGEEDCPEDHTVKDDSDFIPSPSGYMVTFCLQDLRLPRIEFDEFAARFVNHMRGIFIYTDLDFKIPKEVCDAVYKATAGHVGLVRHSFRILADGFRSGTRSVTAMLRYLTSRDFRERLRYLRSFGWLRKWGLSAMEEQFLRDALLHLDDESTFPRNSDGFEEIITKFRRCGLLIDARTNRLQFAAPLVRIFLMDRLFTASLHLRKSLVRASDFDAFLRLSIERIRPSALRESLSRGSYENSRLYERAWQQEWFRAATTAVPENMEISPDVGPVFGANGYIDFYIGDLEWGVEFLCEGDNMKEHACRFADEGVYAKIPLKYWAIIDFRHESKRLNSMHPHFWHVSYANDYSSVVIRRLNEQPLQVVLRGDELS